MILPGLLALTALSVAPALDGGFTFDEDAGVAANRAIHPGVPAHEALTFRFSPDQMRPLFFLSLWLDARWHGPAPRGFRLTNLMLHLACGLVVYLLLRRAAEGFGRPGVAPEVTQGAVLAGAALFLLHPLQAESIIYIWGRSGVLSALGALLALHAAPRPGEGPAPRLRSWVPAWALFALALAAKEEAIILPLLALLYWGVIEGRPIRPSVSAAARLALPAALFVALRLFLLGAAGRQVYVRSVAENALGQGVVSLRMLALTLWPAGLSVDHEARVPSAGAGIGAIAACALLAGAAFAVALRARRPVLRAAGAGALAYAAGMLLYWIVPLPDLMSERRAYLPLWGAALVVTALAMGLADHVRGGGAHSPAWRRTAAALLPVLAVAMLLAPALHSRARLWADPALLWQEAAARAPRKARPSINLGVLAVARGDRSAAATHLDHAVALEPANPEARYNRGRLRLDNGDLPGAEADLRAAIIADPTVPRVRINLAVALVRQGRLAEAEEELRTALRIDPGEPRALTNLAEILRETGRAAAALPLYRQALASDPGYAHAAARLGVALEAAGDPEGALDAYRDYLARGPASETDAAAVRARISAIEAALAAPGSIR